MLTLLAVSLILCLVSISGEGWAKKLPPKMHNRSVFASFLLEISTMMSCPFCERWEAGVWNQGIFRILFSVLLKSYVEIILETMISRIFPYPAVGVIFEKCILSFCHKLAYVDPAGTLDSFSETQSKHKKTHNNVIEVEIRTLYM